MTLDKVIKALSIDRLHEIGRYDGAGWYLVTEDELNEARQYLQAYKVSMDDLIALRAYWAEQQANNPITWDELNQMVGKPVWVEGKGLGGAGISDIGGFCAVISRFCVDNNGDVFVRFTDGSAHYLEDFNYMPSHVFWQAYRKER